MFGLLSTAILALVFLIVALFLIWLTCIALITFRKEARSKKNIRILLVLSLALFVIALGKGFWWRALSISAADLLVNNTEKDLLERRRFLLNRVARHDFGPKDIPAVIASPFREELAISTLSMTTFALTNLAFIYPDTQFESKHAIKRMIEAMLTDQIRHFEVLWWGHDPLSDLQSTKGSIGYLGHLHLMLGCYRLLGGDSEFDNLYTEISEELARRMRASPSLHIETFPGTIFTADNTILIASLKIYDLIHGPIYHELVERWVDYTKQHLLDRETGLVVYYVNMDGSPNGTPRGVLQAWNSIWLPIIDKQFAKSQYDISKALLADELTNFKLGGFREYPRGITGPTDIISGPIIAGISASATGFIIAGARWWEDTDYLDSLLRTTELVGSTVSVNGQRTYLFSPLVGDAIVLATMTVTEFDNRFIKQGN